MYHVKNAAFSTKENINIKTRAKRKPAKKKSEAQLNYLLIVEE